MKASFNPSSYYMNLATALPPTKSVKTRPFVYGVDAMSFYISMEQILTPQDITRWQIPFLSESEEMWWDGVKYLELNPTKYRVTLTPAQSDLSGIKRDLIRTNIKGVYWQVAHRYEHLIFYNNLINTNIDRTVLETRRMTI